MAADFYRSSHGKSWLVDRKTLISARTLDLKYATAQEIAWIAIWSANAIQKLGKRLSLRQQVVATAIVYLRRFYTKNSYCETDVPLVAAACVYVAAKAEETAIHIKVVVTEARATFNEYGIVNFPSDSTKLAEMEFYLIEDLEFNLIIYHPYRSLVHMTGRDTGPIPARETTLDMDDNSMQMAWFVLNDTYRSELCLLYPPHLIAIASIYLAFSLHFPPSMMSKPPGAVGRPRNADTDSEPDAKRMRTQSFSGQPQNPPMGANLLGQFSASPSMPSSPMSGNPGMAQMPPKTAIPSVPRGKTDPITFLASLNVQMPLVLEIVQEILSLYACWKSYEEPPTPASPTTPDLTSNGGVAQDSAAGTIASLLGGPASSLQPLTRMPSAGSGFPGMGGRGMGPNQPGAGDERTIQIINRIRYSRDMDLAHPAHAGAPSAQSQ